MSIYIQEVLGLLKRNKKKLKLDKTRDHFEFGKLYRNSTLNSGGVYSPTMEPFVVKFGDLVCEITEHLTRTKINSGVPTYFPVYTDPEGSCTWDTLMDSIMTQNIAGNTISIGGDLVVNGTATVTSLTDNRVVIVGAGGLLEDDANFTMDGTTLTANVNVVHGTDVPAGTPAETTTINSNLKLEGPVYDSLGIIGGLNKVLVGLADGRVKWQDDDAVEALTYGSLWQGDATNYKQELAIGTTGQILISDGTTFSWQNNPTISGSGTLYRLPLWTPDGLSLGDSLLIQDGDVSTPATQVKNDGILRNVGIVKLDSVAQDDTLTEILVRDTGSSNEVKYRDVASITPATGFDTLTMGMSGWTQTFLNAYVELDDTAGGAFIDIKGMTGLTDGTEGVVIAKNVKTGTKLAQNVIRFPNGWGVAGNLFDNSITWDTQPTMINNGYPTKSILFGESVKFKYINYKYPTVNNQIFWDACCKMLSLNTCPVANPGSATFAENTTHTDTVSVTDDGYGGYPMTYTVVTPPTNGTLAFLGSTGGFTYTPTANYNGVDSFTFTGNDGYCTSNISTFSFVVTAVASNPLWTSTDPVSANTYPNLTGGNLWEYDWTTNDPDHPCNQLTYVITVDGVEIFPASGSSWLTFTNNNDCTGTLSGTYPNTGGNHQVVMTVTDPDNNSDTQTFNIGGLAITPQTYLVFVMDSSGSMYANMATNSKMLSSPSITTRSKGQYSGTNTLGIRNGQVGEDREPGRVNAADGKTDAVGYGIEIGMEVTGNGIPANTTVTGLTTSMIIILSNPQTSNSLDIITFSRTAAMKSADYATATNFRNLLQDFYRTAGTEASGNTNRATNGSDEYDNHLYIVHTPEERQIKYLAPNQLGINPNLTPTIGASGAFPNADKIVMLGWGDESQGPNSYNLNLSGTGTWNDRATSIQQNIVDDVLYVQQFISQLETAASTTNIFRGIYYRVAADASAGFGDQLQEIIQENGLLQSGGVLGAPNNFAYPPAASAYNVSTQTLRDQSTGSPTKIIYNPVISLATGMTYPNPTPVPAEVTYVYNLVKANLNTLGFGL
tara:strand:+ start:6168 stop:9353 length:3186 start_codon:yes stop_codon:yes gene_type:complete